MVQQNLLIISLLLGLVILVGDVSADNQAPVAVADSYRTPMNTWLTVEAPGLLANDYDPDGDVFRLGGIIPPAHGDLTYTYTGWFRYIPDDDYIGTDSFSYNIYDGELYSGEATVTITVGAGPVSVADSYRTHMNTPLIVEAPGLLANDYDPDGGAIQVYDILAATHGMLVFDETGRFWYDPDDDYTGTDSFSYNIYNGELYSGYATVTITVSNTVPVAVADSYRTPMNTPLTVEAPGLLANDYNPDGDLFRLGGTTPPAHGTLSVTDTGSFVYIPDKDYTGTDSFSYSIYDGGFVSGYATVTITVGYTAPVAVADSFSTQTNTPLTVEAPGLLANDYDQDGDLFRLGGTSPPAHGALSAITDTGSFMYTPDPYYSGTDSFRYYIFDGPGLFSEYTTVTITVNGGKGASLSMEKSSDVSALPAGGGDVEYTYVVKNTGHGGISALALSDDQLGTITAGPSGDTNGNGILDMGETWTYSVPAHLTQTTINTATVTGMDPAGLEVSATSNAVTVTVESLPAPEFPTVVIPVLVIAIFASVVMIFRRK